MGKVIIIRPRHGLISIPVEKAIYCASCETISTSPGKRCGLCGSEEIVELAPLLTGPSNPGPASAAAAIAA